VDLALAAVEARKVPAEQIRDLLLACARRAEYEHLPALPDASTLRVSFRRSPLCASARPSALTLGASRSWR
jgi:hypothetical protein